MSNNKLISSGTDINTFRSTILQQSNNKAKTQNNFMKKPKTEINFYKTNRINLHEKESNNEYMKQLLKTMITTKKSNYDLTKEIIQEKEENIKQAKLITQLESELAYYEELSLLIQGGLYLTSQRKQKISISENQAQAYCKEVKRKFKSVVEIIDNFENKLNEIGSEKLKIEEFFTEQLKDIAEEKLELFNESEEINDKINNQKRQINELNQKIEGLLRDKLNQRIFFQNKEDDDLKKYEQLTEKYNELALKMKDYLNQEATNQYNTQLTKRVLNEMVSEKEEFIMKLNDKKLLNDTMKAEVNNLNSQIAEALKAIENFKKIEKSRKNKFGFHL